MTVKEEIVWRCPQQILSMYLLTFLQHLRQTPAPLSTLASPTPSAIINAHHTFYTHTCYVCIWAGSKELCFFCSVSDIWTLSGLDLSRRSIFYIQYFSKLGCNWHWSQQHVIPVCLAHSSVQQFAENGRT